MKPQFFKVNWTAVNKAIPENLKELRQAQKELSNKIQKKVNDYYRLEREKMAAEKVAALKSLPVNSDVYYIGRGDKVEFGAKGKKVKDKRIRMLAEFDNTTWDCPYTALIDRPPTDQEIKNRKIEKEFSRIVSNIKW